MEAFSPPKSEDPDETLYECWDCPQVTVLHSYNACQPDELSLTRGDVINVLRKMSDGNWFSLAFFFCIPHFITSHRCWTIFSRRFSFHFGDLNALHVENNKIAFKEIWIRPYCVFFFLFYQFNGVRSLKEREFSPKVRVGLVNDRWLCYIDYYINLDPFIS